MQLIIIFAIAVLTVGCFQPSRTDFEGPPYSIGDFQADVIPLKRKSSSELSDLVLTLPVFEVSPSDRRAWVERNGVESIDKDTLTIAGDGAQCPLTIKRLPSGPGSKQRIRVTLEPWDLPNAWQYEFERADHGWVRLNVQVMKNPSKAALTNR